MKVIKDFVASSAQRRTCLGMVSTVATTLIRSGAELLASLAGI
ncbi:MAG: hypothetical protein O3C57_06140 [Verrucomicrobia bacterium]|nr:hypothetical protein [Verrucomicrobiota bacterium]